MHIKAQIYLFFSIVALTASTAFAQSQTTAPTGSGSEEKAVISGHVSVDGNSAAGQTVALWHDNRLGGQDRSGLPGNIAAHVTTDQQGDYRFDGVSAGRYVVFPSTPTLACV
ncbi:MAG TPA: hypothetical protein VI756_11765, partial [Blastocatellia bacterium]